MSKPPSPFRRVLLLTISLFGLALTIGVVATARLREGASERQRPNEATAGLRSPREVRAEPETEDQGAASVDVVEQMRGFSMQRRRRAPYGKVDPEVIHRDVVMAELRRIGRRAVPRIARALKDPDVQMRKNATLVLIDLVEVLPGERLVDTRPAIPSLIEATGDPDHQVRAWAAYALSAIGPDARKAVPSLIRLLKDTEEGPRNNGAIALGRIGAAAKAGIPALRGAMADPKEDVRRFATTAIAQIEEACAKGAE